LPDIVSIQVQRLPIVAATAQSDMHMRVLGIEMGNGRPFERSAQILSHAPHHVAREPNRLTRRHGFQYDDRPPDEKDLI
jgi:hypothetical protein